MKDTYISTTHEGRKRLMDYKNRVRRAQYYRHKVARKRERRLDRIGNVLVVFSLLAMAALMIGEVVMVWVHL